MLGKKCFEETACFRDRTRFLRARKTLTICDCDRDSVFEWEDRAECLNIRVGTKTMTDQPPEGSRKKFAGNAT